MALTTLAVWCTAQAPPAANAPERAYLSPEKYANAFFGFAMTLPPPAHFAVLTNPSKPPGHFLIGLQSRTSRLTGIHIIAEPAVNAPASAVKDAISREDSHTKKIKIGGKDFWRAESKLETAFGKQEFIGYGIALDGYILQFQIVSVDPELTAELEQMVQSLTFFDPANVREIAGADSRPYPVDTHAIEAASRRIAELDPGSVSGNTYFNSYFGLSYRFPARWTNADKAALPAITEDLSEKAAKFSPEQQIAAHCTRVLLWTAKYPQAKREGEFDPYILFAVADPACLPVPVAFPTSIQDLAGVQEFANAVIQSFTGTALLGYGKAGVFKGRAMDVGGHLFIEMPTNGLIAVPGTRLYRKVHLGLAITDIRNYWLIWAFASDSVSELHDMMKTSIVITPPPRDQEPAMR